MLDRGRYEGVEPEALKEEREVAWAEQIDA